jgi:hypothetical protein
MNAREINLSPMTDEERRFLGQAFSEDIAGLEKLLNKDLSHWKTLPRNKTVER